MIEYLSLPPPRQYYVVGGRAWAETCALWNHFTVGKAKIKPFHLVQINKSWLV